MIAPEELAEQIIALANEGFMTKIQASIAGQLADGLCKGAVVSALDVMRKEDTEAAVIIAGELVSAALRGAGAMTEPFLGGSEGGHARLMDARTTIAKLEQARGHLDNYRISKDKKCANQAVDALKGVGR